MLCRFYQQGACRFGDQCRYAHEGPESLGKSAPPPPVPPPVDDRPVCTYFLAGTCNFGDTCRFSHAAQGGKKGGKKGGGKPWWKGKTKGKGVGKKGVDWEEWSAGKGPGMSGLQNNASEIDQRSLTGPYLGRGSELFKVWSMPEDMGHEDGIRAAVLMGDRVCTGGADRRLLLWRGEQQASPEQGLALAQDNEVNFSEAVTALLFEPTSRWLFCGLADGQVRAFRQEPFAEQALTGHTQPVTSLLVHESVLISGSADGAVRAWKYDAQLGGFACAATVAVPLGPVFSLLVQQPDSLWVGAQRGISCVSLQTLQPVGSIDASSRVVRLVPYQGCVLAAFADGVVKVFDASGKEQFSHGPLGEHTTNTAVALVRQPHANKDVLLCGQEYGYITAYDIPDFRPRGTFTTGYEGDISAIIDMGSDGIFATFGLSGDVVLWRWERAG